MSTLVTDPVAAGEALAAIALGAAERDRVPRFPSDALAALGAAGFMTPSRHPSEEWDRVRTVARADGSVARILDGHLNACERLRLLAPEALRGAELGRAERGELLLGLWGADPAPGHGEGEPARLRCEPGGEAVLRGAKTFCSGAGGVHRAIVLARRSDDEPPSLAYLDVTDPRCEVDRSWYRAAGLRASESHRVTFDDAPVLAVLGEPGELSREPLFGRDAIRTAAHWAGLADAAADLALGELVRRREDPITQLAAGRIEIARATIEAWFDRAGRILDADPARPAAELSICLRAAVAREGAAVLDEAARALGARPFATGGPLDRVRRDFELFVLQHRLDPMIARLGAAALGRSDR